MSRQRTTKGDERLIHCETVAGVRQPDRLQRQEETPLRIRSKIHESRRRQLPRPRQTGLLLGPSSFLLSEGGARFGVLLGVVGDDRTNRGCNTQSQDRYTGGPGCADRAAMLVDLLGLQFVLRHTSDRRSDVGDRIPKPGMPQVQLRLSAGEPQIHPARLIGKHAE